MYLTKCFHMHSCFLMQSIWSNMLSSLSICFRKSLEKKSNSCHSYYFMILPILSEVIMRFSFKAYYTWAGDCRKCNVFLLLFMSIKVCIFLIAFHTILYRYDNFTKFYLTMLGWIWPSIFKITWKRGLLRIGNLQIEHWCVMSARYLGGCITYALTGVH